MPEKVNVDNIPLDLRGMPRWLVTRLKPAPTKADPNHTKKPPFSVKRFGTPKEESEFDVFKEPDPALLSTLDEAIAVLPYYDRLGFCITGTRFIVLDLDHCLKDRIPTLWASEILRRFHKGSYIEVSPTGDGLHLWLQEGMNLKPELADDAKDVVNFPDGGKLEVFYRGYVTVTGDIYEVTADE